MKKSSWRDRFEFALQAAIERSSGVRELATRGLEEGAKQIGAWQERQRQAEVFGELGRAVYQLARAGRLRDLEDDPTIAHLLERIEHAGSSGAALAFENDDDGTVSAASAAAVGHRAPPRTSWGAPVAKFDALAEAGDGDDEGLAAYMHKDDLEQR